MLAFRAPRSKAAAFALVARADNPFEFPLAFVGNDARIPYPLRNEFHKSHKFNECVVLEAVLTLERQHLEPFNRTSCSRELQI
jgi:hypothetical protein